MGSSQLMLLVSGLIILGLLSLMVLNSMNRNTDSNMYNQALLAGTGIAQSSLEEIAGKYFDEKVIGKTVMSVDSLTAPAYLGADGGETSAATFDDVDDYKNYTRQDTLTVFGTFYTSVNVYYVVNLNPDQTSSSRTFAKRIDVKVVNSYVSDTIRVYSIKAY